MDGRIIVVAMIEDGTSREVLLSNAERGQVLALLLQMFRGRPLPVSQTELPLEPIIHSVDAQAELRRRMRGEGGDHEPEE